MNDIQAKQEEDRRRIRERHKEKVEHGFDGYFGEDQSSYIRNDATYTANSGVVGRKQDDGEAF